MARNLQPRWSSSEWFQAFLLERDRQRVKPKTRENYHWALDPFVQRFPVLPFDRDVILGYVKDLTVAPGSMKLALQILKAFYHWLHEERGAPDVRLGNPHQPRNPNRPTFWTQDQLRHILSKCEAQWEVAAVTALAQTGARREELCSITQEHFHGSWAMVDSKVTHTNPSGRRVLYIPQASELAITMCMGGRGRLYMGRAPMTPKNLEWGMRELLRRAGLYQRGVGCHSFRHSYSGEYLNNGGDMAYLDALMGHANPTWTPEMTSLYLHTLQDRVMEAAMKFAPSKFLQAALPVGGAP